MAFNHQKLRRIYTLKIEARISGNGSNYGVALSVRQAALFGGMMDGLGMFKDTHATDALAAFDAY